MRRFEVWLDKGVVGAKVLTCTVEMPSDASDDECDEACRAALDSLIEQLDTGWLELGADE